MIYNTNILEKERLQMLPSTLERCPLRKFSLEIVNLEI